MPARFVVIDPPLGEGEVRFLAAFAADAAVRRVWPGQPRRCCPWRPSEDGRFLLLVDELADQPDDADAVASWLRFLSREFLAPSTETSLDAALTAGLRGGHRVRGEVVVGGRRVTIDVGRVTIEDLEPAAADGRDAVVVDLDTRRAQAAPPAAQTER
ncbi:hypothetical protein [Nocardioides litoris]|uniref:hypothetical protein n=1 Tax=Nocardioides litoris TaxID=1926648 RepID=UPI00111E5A19|nr:hypothetical protein [Nocardioides litoris]